MGESSEADCSWAFCLYFASSFFAKHSLGLNSTLASSFRIVLPILRCPLVVIGLMAFPVLAVVFLGYNLNYWKSKLDAESDKKYFLGLR